VNDGTKLADTVAVLAVGGEKLSSNAAKAELITDRKAVGTSILFGGNCFPNDYPADKGGVQFFNDETLTEREGLP